MSIIPEKLEILKNEQEEILTFKVILPIQGDYDEKCGYSIEEAVKYLNKNGYKNKLGKLIHYNVISNVSDYRRKGYFIFELKNAAGKKKQKPQNPVIKTKRKSFVTDSKKVEE